MKSPSIPLLLGTGEAVNRKSVTCLRQVLLEETPTTSSMRPSLHFSGRPDTATTPVLSSFRACHLLHISFSPQVFKILTLECETELAFPLLVPTASWHRFRHSAGTLQGGRARPPAGGRCGSPLGLRPPRLGACGQAETRGLAVAQALGVFLLKPIAPPRPLLQGT